MNNPILVFLAVIGASYLAKIIYDALLEWRQEGKENPLHLDRNTLDQIKLEREGYHVIWKDGKPVVLPKNPKE